MEKFFTLQMVDFNSNPEMFIFLLSTRAGGLGINMIGTDTDYLRQWLDKSLD